MKQKILTSCMTFIGLLMASSAMMAAATAAEAPSPAETEQAQTVTKNVVAAVSRTINVANSAEPSKAYMQLEKWSSGGYNSCIKFDLSEVKASEAFEVKSAKIQLTHYGDKNSISLNVYPAGTSWNNSTSTTNMTTLMKAAEKEAKLIDGESYIVSRRMNEDYDNGVLANAKGLEDYQFSIDVTDYVKAEWDNDAVAVMLSPVIAANNVMQVWSATVTDVNYNQTKFKVVSGNNAKQGLTTLAAAFNMTASDFLNAAKPTLVLELEKGSYDVEYNVTVTPSENGTVTASPEKAASGTEVKLTITPAEGYALGTLTVTDDKNNAVEVTDNSFTMPEGAVTISATFVTGTYNVTITNAENGTVTATPGKANEGDVITLTVTPAENYSLKSLSAAPYTDDDSDGAGIGELSRAQVPSIAGDIVLTTVVEGAEYTFIMPACHVQVTAEFTNKPVALPTYAYDEDTNQVTLTPATGKEGYADNTKIWYTTDGSDPATSATKIETSVETIVTVTSDMNTIRMIGVDSEGNTSAEVAFSVSRARFLTVTKEWVTFCYPETFAVPAGLKAYTVTAIQEPVGTTPGTITLKEQSVIAKNMPMLLQNTTISGTNEPTTRFRISAADDVTINSEDMCSQYIGVTETTTLPATGANYVLKDGVFVLTTASTIKAYSCFLSISGNNARSYIITTDHSQSTSINTLRQAVKADSPWYDLGGRRTKSPLPKKGIYINNGRKAATK